MKYKMRIMKYTIFGLLFIVIGFICSCADDKGNYNYQDINKLSITRIETGNAYRKISHVDTLRIYPEVKSLTGAEGEYTYEWKFIPQNADKDKGADTLDFVVATTKDLELPITLKADSYTCFYRVEDKATKVSWYQKFYLQVSSLTSEGWMVLCEQDGQSRMDMIVNVDANTDIISRDIWSESDLVTGKPVKLMSNFSGAGGNIYLFTCENGTYRLDQTDMHAGEDNNIKWNFGDQPNHMHVQASGVSLYDYYQYNGKYEFIDYLYWIVIDENGDVYCNNVSVNGGLFEFPINEINGMKFKAAPFVANACRYRRGGGSYTLGGTSTMLYDEAGRFIEVKAKSGGIPSVMKFSGDEILFPAEQEGKEMVLMQSTVNDGLTYVVLKDRAGDYYYYGIVLGTEGVNTQRYYGKLSGTDVDQATLFACHPLYGTLFYATKDRIYEFDMKNPSTPVKEICHFPGETIKVLKFNPFSAFRQYKVWEDMRSEHLVVGTTIDGADEKGCGIMRTYEFEPQWDKAPILKKEHKGLGKIVDIAYKEIR